MTEQANLPEAIKALGEEWKSTLSTIGENVKKQGEELKTTGKTSEETAKTLATYTEKMDQLVAEMKGKQEELQKRLDDAETERKRFNAVIGSEQKSIGAIVVESEAYKQMLSGGGRLRSGPVKFKGLELPSAEKEKATFLLSGAPAGFVQPMRVAPVLPTIRRLRIRDLLPVRRTTASSIEYLQETGFYDATNTVSVSSITQTGGTATVTTGAAHGLNEGDRVKIAGANQAGYNGTKRVLEVVSATVFEMAVDSGTVSPATGTITMINLTDAHGAAGTVTEGSEKPEATLEFELKTATVQVIAHWMPISRQAVADADQLMAYIDDRLRYGLASKEEEQLLYGNGTTPNLQGLLTHAERQTYAWSEGPTDPVPDTKIDALRRAMTKVQVAEYEPSGIVLNPQDWEDVQLAKGDDGHYIWININRGGEETFFRLPLVITNAIAAGQALVGAFQLAATLWDREQAEVRISDEHSDYFVKNLVAILAEERLALTTYRPESFVDVSFDAAPSV
jgi:hypothetical protein